MTSDKPGTVIPLAGDKTSTPVDSNVTVLSWGHLKGDLFSGQKHKKKKPKNEVEKCSSESGEHFHNNNFPGTQGIPEALRAGKPVSSSEEVTPEYHRPKKHSKKKKRALRTSTRSYKTRFRTIKQSLIQKYQIDLNEYRERSNHLISRYLTQKEQGNLVSIIMWQNIALKIIIACKQMVLGKYCYIQKKLINYARKGFQS
ncbi:hypothetical protein O3G_MSEX001965 [Manduca sexta]|uniref:Uncharacterized protein n=1 Tax=Manduca sexta TaxID=7130 RepID=A0A921YMI0_MANSE|nr:hypothetical protein O3G_MSEX001965 [Manduca sexta]